MATPAPKVAKTSAGPELTVGLLSGALIWGPQRVEPGTTAGQLAECLPRPMSCPGVELVHGTNKLKLDVDVSALPDGARLTARMQPPKPFDHSFVFDMLNLDGVMDEASILPLSCLKPAAVNVPDAEVLRVEYLGQGDSYEQQRLRLRLRVPEGSSWLSKDHVQLEDDSIECHVNAGECDKITIKDGSVQARETNEEGKFVEVEVNVEEHDIYSWRRNIIEWTPIDGLVEKHFARRAFEGISCSTTDVPAAFIKHLNELIDSLKVSEPPDYHPGSNNVVRDLVHPSLYPYIKGVSMVAPDLTQEEVAVVEQAREPVVRHDMWKRPYEDSKYQWLPAEVSVSDSGKCEFQTYINNLPKEKYCKLYTALGELLSKSLPHLEAVWSHGSAVEFLDDDDDVYDIGSDAEDRDMPEKVLKGRTLQVIVKIVDYELAPGQTHEGVWHVEGMSHENIVATAELVLQRPGVLAGGELEFQRAWTRMEAGRFGGLPQCRAHAVESCIEKGLAPLGRLPLELGQLTAWPNSHVHKLSPLTNKGDAPAQRRIVVLWLVNPEKRIISSRHVPPQQSTMSLDEAKAHRAELMEERKRHKQDWNIREVSLCEH